MKVVLNSLLRPNNKIVVLKAIFPLHHGDSLVLSYVLANQLRQSTCYTLLAR